MDIISRIRVFWIISISFPCRSFAYGYWQGMGRNPQIASTRMHQPYRINAPRWTVSHAHQPYLLIEMQRPPYMRSDWNRQYQEHNPHLQYNREYRQNTFNQPYISKPQPQWNGNTRTNWNDHNQHVPYSHSTSYSHHSNSNHRTGLMRSWNYMGSQRNDPNYIDPSNSSGFRIGYEGWIPIGNPSVFPQGPRQPQIPPHIRDFCNWFFNKWDDRHHGRDPSVSPGLNGTEGRRNHTSDDRHGTDHRTDHNRTNVYRPDHNGSDRNRTDYNRPDANGNVYNRSGFDDPNNYHRSPVNSNGNTDVTSNGDLNPDNTINPRTKLDGDDDDTNNRDPNKDNEIIPSNENDEKERNTNFPEEASFVNRENGNSDTDAFPQRINSNPTEPYSSTSSSDEDKKDSSNQVTPNGETTADSKSEAEADLDKSGEETENTGNRQDTDSTGNGQDTDSTGSGQDADSTGNGQNTDSTGNGHDTDSTGNGHDTDSTGNKQDSDSTGNSQDSDSTGNSQDSDSTGNRQDSDSNSETSSTTGILYTTERMASVTKKTETDRTIDDVTIGTVSVRLFTTEEDTKLVAGTEKTVTAAIEDSGTIVFSTAAKPVMTERAVTAARETVESAPTTATETDSKEVITTAKAVITESTFTADAEKMGTKTQTSVSTEVNFDTTTQNLGILGDNSKTVESNFLVQEPNYDFIEQEQILID